MYSSGHGQMAWIALGHFNQTAQVRMKDDPSGSSSGHTSRIGLDLTMIWRWRRMEADHCVDAIFSQHTHLLPSGCSIRSVVQHRVLVKYPSPCWVGSVGAGCARTPACSESVCGCGCQSPWSWIDPLDTSPRTHAQQERRTPGLLI